VEGGLRAGVARHRLRPVVADLLPASAAALARSEPAVREGQGGQGGARCARGKAAPGAGLHRLRRRGATQDTVTQLVAAIRAALREVPGADQVVAAYCTAHDYTDPGNPKIAWNDEAARAALVDALVTDALNVLGHLPDQQLGEAGANAVGILVSVLVSSSPVGE
jgi:hypothetical protein